jgi:hypothetical protein
MSYKTILQYALSLMLLWSCIFLFCSDEKTIPGQDGKIVSVNTQTSPCGGFKGLAKRSAGGILPEDTIPCLEETLFWRFDATSGVLTLVHRCVSDNCAAQLTMYVSRNGSKLTILKTDSSDPNVRASCDCTFDMYCEVPDLSGQTVTLALDTFSFTLPLDAQKGKILLHPLQYLSLSNTTHADLSFLSEYPHLKSLGQVDAEAYSDLSPIGQLSELTSFSGYNIASLGFLAPCTKLANLDIGAISKLIDISTLRIFNNLTSLCIIGPSSFQDISPIGACASLTNLTLSDCHAVIDISSLGGLTKLQALRLSKMPAVATLPPIANLIGLTDLSLDSLTGIASLEPLRALTNIKSLYISNNGAIIDISSFSALTSLKSLGLTNLTAIADFSPLVSCLDSGETFVYPGTPVPQNILDQLRQKGVAYKGGMAGK